jgi:transposase InsO family protein
LSEVTRGFLGAEGVRHTRIRPGHAWTNGRIERVFRTFKSTVFGVIWLFVSLREVDAYCRDFVQYYNRDRPHSSWGWRTPDEVYFGRVPVKRPLGEVTYFGGRLRWFRFGFG